MLNYPEDKPFGEWTPEQQREFKIATRVDGLCYVEMLPVDVWSAPIKGRVFNAHPACYYRLAPEPEIDDSIDWSHVHPDFVTMRRLVGWNSGLLMDKGDFSSLRARVFASYKRGNKPSCTVYRPGFEPK